ncbi:QcrA and Rieske domain-containing protein [Leptolyngbya iicbica]|uniref:Rieske (2Fe-2S) protein n=2 Tax=Cyanophyceae TaxID=3028117 RepID=A0A4Q7EEQ6_9CYAN|nr:Rieske (2Fe-2S) protein [Leptolyngbya sp. LK]RZM82011.1 Rieske (2Fe-2S) protein [Leptolyngbya sp. LK]
MNRRDFVNWMGVGALATSLPVALAACGSDTAEAPADAPADNTAAAPADDAAAADGFESIGTVAELDEAGALASSNFQGTQVVVTRSPDNPDTLIAVDSLCTHQGCTVDWDGSAFACPCHASMFNPDGTVASGPASAPLPVYEAKIEGDQVLVKV